MTSVPINQTNNRYTFSLLNIDDINYANKTLSLCMYVQYVCMYDKVYACMSVYLCMYENIRLGFNAFSRV